MSIYKQRVLELRRLMKENNIDAYLILSADPHLSEYLPEYYKNRVFISGFKGSVGTVLITQEEGFLWVDGRYWLIDFKTSNHMNYKYTLQSINLNLSLHFLYF